LQRPWIGALALLLVIGGAGRAGAAASPSDPKQEAKARFVSGQSHYNLNEFPEALRDFKEGYRLFPDPVFLYNLGQCERQLGHPDEAIRFYRSFLREQPKAPNRQDVLHKIEEMEAALKAKQPEGDKAVAPLEPAQAAKPSPLPGEAKPALPPLPEPPKTPPAAPAPAEQKAAVAPPSSPYPPAQTLPATPPVTPAIAETTGNKIDLSSTPEPQAEAGAPPIYKRWWFWTAAAAVAAGAGIGIYAATSGHGPAVPGSVLGSKKVF
jgi:tetratricopeptide (TPR) repeat protein